MEIRKFTGGKIIGTKSDRLQFPLYADDPSARFQAPGTLSGNVGLGVLMSEASKRQTGEPKPLEAKVVLREQGAELHLMISFPPRATKAEGAQSTKDPDIHPIYYTGNARAPVIRGLKRLFADAGVAIMRDLWYIMVPELVADDQLGYSVACNWTKARTEPIKHTAEEERTAAPSPAETIQKT
jgi:hypothetical protein